MSKQVVLSMAEARGRFITLEGGEGAGKTTALRFILDYLEKSGISALATREPGGTPLGEKIRELLLGPNDVVPEAELLLVFAARAQHLRHVIEPALASGHWVISDRFTDASYAYQGGGRGLGTGIIATLESWVQNGLRPDLTLFLDVSSDIGLSRARQRGSADRFEVESQAFFGRVMDAYRGRAAAEPDRIKRVDASRSIEKVQSEIAGYLDDFLHG